MIGIDKTVTSSYPCPSSVTIFSWKSTELRLRGFHLRTSAQLPATYGWNRETSITWALHTYRETSIDHFCIHNFSTIAVHISGPKKNWLHKWCIIMLDAPFICIVFLHESFRIPRPDPTIFLEWLFLSACACVCGNSESNMMFLEYVAVLTCLY
jgi:hypothetical protein